VVMPEAGAPTPGPTLLRGMVSPAERAALETGVVVASRADLARYRLTGPGRVACLQGLVTCDVDKPGDDSHAFGALLTAKGMIVTPLWIMRTAEAFLIEAPAGAAAEIAGAFERSLPPRLCRYEGVTEQTASIGVYGPGAAAALADAAGGPGPGVTGRIARFGDAAARVVAARIVSRGLDGFDCFVAANAADGLVTALVGRGAMRVSAALLEERRILAGFPRLGAEIDQKTLPQEVRLDELGAVSFTKGCYLGQETVARVHFRGHANRVLAGVEMDRLPAALPTNLEADGRPAGRLTSACWWEAGGCYASLAVLRRGIEPGMSVHTDDGREGTVRELPWVLPSAGAVP
jgi:folate-binding protein YgfZ